MRCCASGKTSSGPQASCRRRAPVGQVAWSRASSPTFARQEQQPSTLVHGTALNVKHASAPRSDTDTDTDTHACTHTHTHTHTHTRRARAWGSPASPAGLLVSGVGPAQYFCRGDRRHVRQGHLARRFSRKRQSSCENRRGGCHWPGSRLVVARGLAARLELQPGVLHGLELELVGNAPRQQLQRVLRRRLLRQLCHHLHHCSTEKHRCMVVTGRQRP